jgi:hypothetical protein
VERVRYDSIWRRIKSDAYAEKLEGSFRTSWERLAELNNWGSLAWHYPHATATKLSHHYGVEYNARHFLDADESRKKYEASFRIAAHALHWGHLPLSYAGAEGLLRASHVDDGVRKVVDGITADVISAASLDCDGPDHGSDCRHDVLVGDRPFELYKWLSAWLVSRRWKKIWGSVKGIVPAQTDQKALKDAVIRTLVCREDFGYQLLDLCRLADYVPRDLLQAGTAWLTVDIDALWETSLLRPDRAREWSLLEASRDYLEDRFFTSPDALLVHTLAARSIAQGILSKPFDRDTLASLLETELGDKDFLSRFPDYHRSRLAQIKDWAREENLPRQWAHIGTFRGVLVPREPLLSVEQQFTGRKGSGQLSYPMNSNFSVVARGGPGAIFFDSSGAEERQVSIQLHHREGGGPGNARPALDIALAARDAQRRNSDEVSKGVVGWLSQGRIDIRARQTHRAAGDLLVVSGVEVQEHLKRIASQTAFRGGRYPRHWKRDVTVLAGSLRNRTLVLGRTALGMPLAVARTKDGKALLEAVRSTPAQGNISKGFALEASAAADQLLHPDVCQRRLLVIGATSLSEEGAPLGEWDVLRLDLLGNGDWRLVAAECTVSPGSQKEAADRDKLERLRAALQGRFTDLAEYQTRLVVPDGDSFRYIDAARGFVRT